LDLESLVLRYVSVAVGKLEIDRCESDRACACDVSNLHTCGLLREDAGPGAFRMRLQVDQGCEGVGGDAPRGLALGFAGDSVEVIAEPAKLGGPLVIHIRQRIKEKLEACLVVVLERCPRHLAHYVVAKGSGETADPKAPRLAHRLVRQRRTVYV